MFLILSASLNPGSRSRILARHAAQHWSDAGVETQVVDLQELPLPLCDGGASYGDPNVQQLAGWVKNAEGILVATPIYNYDVNAAIKNALELTGRNWIGKTVGFLCAAGGQGSYMSVMAFANSLMLDFRCLIVPRFVYVDGSVFEGDELADEDVERRISELCDMTGKLAGLAEPIEE